MSQYVPRATVSDTGPSTLLVEIATGGQSFPGDEPIGEGGSGLGPNPYDLLSAALATCTTMTLRLYADHKGWPLEHLVVTVTHEKETGAIPADRFNRTINLTGALDEAQQERLLQIADRCPVHRTLTAGARIVTKAV